MRGKTSSLLVSKMQKTTAENTSDSFQIFTDLCNEKYFTYGPKCDNDEYMANLTFFLYFFSFYLRLQLDYKTRRPKDWRRWQHSVLELIRTNPSNRNWDKSQILYSEMFEISLLVQVQCNRCTFRVNLKMSTNLLTPSGCEHETMQGRLCTTR